MSSHRSPIGIRLYTDADLPTNKKYTDLCRLLSLKVVCPSLSPSLIRLLSISDRYKYTFDPNLFVDGQVLIGFCVT
jgi:hypothetical protein